MSNEQCKPAEIKRLLTLTWKEWDEDQAPRLGAALAYYTVFSLAPLLLLLIAIAGLVFGEQAARGQIMAEIEGMVGAEGASAIQSMIENTSRGGAGVVASILGFLTLMFGASTVAKELKASLNLIWNKEASNAKGIRGMIKERTTALGIVLACGFLLMVSLVASSLIAALGTFLTSVLPLPEATMQVLTFAFALVVNTGVFAMIMKFLPDVQIAWPDVLPGAALTAVLFAIGMFIISIYIGKAGFSSTFGAAGSLVIVLAWVYYSAQIFFFGAEFTQVYAREWGSNPLKQRGKDNRSVRTQDTAITAAQEYPASGNVLFETPGRPAGVAGGLIGSALAATRIYRAFRK